MRAAPVLLAATCRAGSLRGARDAAPVGAPHAGANPHVAPASLPYPPAVKWLLAVAGRGAGIPPSYVDVLPDTGGSYWASREYLDVGALDEDDVGAPLPLDSEVAIQERTLTRYGLNLYDGGVWEIALSLWGRRDVAAVYERNVLYTSSTGAGGHESGNPGGLGNIRADRADFKYGVYETRGDELRTVTYPGNVTRQLQDRDGTPTKVSKGGPGSLFIRMVAPQYIMQDPMVGHYANSWKSPWPVEDPTVPYNTYGLIHFNDWKPIVGENVWAAIIGPLQSLSVATGGNLSNSTCGAPQAPVPCTWEDYAHVPPPVQLGITILPGLEALQSPLGALYHAPKGANLYPHDEAEGQSVSNENNFSAYAALKMLLAVLTDYTSCDTVRSRDPLIQYACDTAAALVAGLDRWFDSQFLLSDAAELPPGADGAPQRVVLQGGHIGADGGWRPAKVNTPGGLAVDCQTWGMTVLGQARFDRSFGAGAAIRAWRATKHLAGYYTAGGALAGVGYTHGYPREAPANSSYPAPRHDVWSAEWTFGAINMAQVLSAQYRGAGCGDCAAWADELWADAVSMYDEVTKLVPDGLRFADGSYMYANQRFAIPWGWFANPIPATCSTGWAVMQERNFDPFTYGGGRKPALPTPPHLAAARCPAGSAAACLRLCPAAAYAACARDCAARCAA